MTRLVRAAIPDAPAARPTLASPASGGPAGPPSGFRQKAHFVFGPPGMGHYARGSRRVVPVTECPVHDPRANAVAFRLRDAFAGLDDPSIKGLAIRAAAHSPEIGATLIVSRPPDKRQRAATKRVLAASPELTSFHINIHPKGDAYVFGDETRKVAGADRVREEVAGASFLISPTAFFQTNVAAAGILVRLVLDAAGPVADAPVLDLYAGAGLFAIPLAKAGHTVVAVEENRAAVADGEASLRLNRVPPGRCRFIAAPVEKALRHPRTTAHHPSAVILDPPREGCSSAVIDGVFGGIRPATAAYVSCDPASLARDLRLIVDRGYRIDSLQPVDMFPHTSHIETVVVLIRVPDRRIHEHGTKGTGRRRAHP